MTKTSTVDNRQASAITLALLSVAVGVVTGLGAILLRMLISVIHNIFFLGEFSLHYDANIATEPGPYGPFVILAPVIGGLIVVFLVKRYAPEAKGHGVPEVMDAIYYKGGKIRPAVVVIKSLASALSIGSGASVGREGPIIQIGSGIGSVLGQYFNLRTWQVITLVAAGAGAGIAATFNTPLGAVLFAIELMLPEFSARTLLPVVLATGTATYMGRLAFGIEPAFLVAAYQRPELFVPLSVDMLPLYVLFGLIAGGAATIFVKVLYGTEDLFNRIKVNDYIKNIVAMTTLGVMFYVLMQTTGMYHTAGVGYATIEAILTGQISAPGFLLLLFFLKMAATSISLAGGSSGGVFSPSLFLGAALGGTFGALLDMAFPYLGFSSVTFALIGMAAIVGGSTGAAMTSIMMLFEMTGDYSITLAAIVAVVCAVGVRSGLSPQDIYTTKLARRGHHIPRDRRSHMFAIRMAREVMEPVAGIFAKEDLPQSVSMSPVQEGARSFALVTEGRFIVGIVPVDPAHPGRVIGPLIGPVGVVRETSFLQSAMTHMVDRGHAAVVVSPDRRIPRPENVLGVLTRDTIAEAVMRDYRT
ncbi:chloride channel protein [Pseudogemmobacter sp. W21_MBD1_M6]|uniref:chloride channel protein n=1 Tax=Pseudogemmobacter sp. W21_MBD1_M6 TaxID=3240271 RepID=UPI003F9563B9